MESTAANGQNTYANSERKSFGKPSAPITKAEKIGMKNDQRG
jgi:hypothetical protein